jgi:FkbH-like protein
MQSDIERQELRRSIKEAVSKDDATGMVEHVRRLLAGSMRPTDVMFSATSFTKAANAIQEQLGARRLRTYVVRSVTIEPILPYLTTEATLSNYLLELKIGGYGSYMDDMLNPDGALARFKPEVVLVLLDLEDVAGRLPELCADGINIDVGAEIEASLGRLAQMLRGIRTRGPARIVVQGFVLPDITSLGDVGDANLPRSLPNAVQRLNDGLAAVCRDIPDCVFFDVDRLAARYGRREWRDTRMFLASRLAVSAGAFEVYAKGLVRSISTLFKAPRKVLCTDLDNTFWGGILGEDGIDGIATGSAFPGNCYLEYQKYLRNLSARGILLAIVSKNNEADVREAFEARAADLALGLDQFAGLKINWNEKSQSIRELAQELSLGLDSFVLVDDNPVECEAVRRQIPEVAVVMAPIQDPWRVIEILSDASYFDAVVVTEDDVNRLGEYKAQAHRAQLEDGAGSREEFLASLEIVCTFLSALDAPLSRAVQLLAKTNQFNLTTRRRSAAEIEEFAAATGGQAIVVRVRDRFGDAGVVGLALARNVASQCYIDSFLLSCRVIGRGIETAMLSHITENARRTGAMRVIGEFIPTKKNAPCANFFSDSGFAKVVLTNETPTNSVLYEFDLTTGVLASPPWITMEGNKSNEFSASAVVSA